MDKFFQRARESRMDMTTFFFGLAAVVIVVSLYGQHLEYQRHNKWVNQCVTAGGVVSYTGPSGLLTEQYQCSFQK